MIRGQALFEKVDPILWYGIVILLTGQIAYIYTVQKYEPNMG